MFNDKQKLMKIVLNLLKILKITEIKFDYEEEIEEKSLRTRKKVLKNLGEEIKVQEVRKII
jgi:hypothetical protein